MLRITDNYTLTMLCGAPHNICNQEAKLKGMEGNRTLYGDVFAGPMYIVGEDTDGEFCGLTEKQVQKYKEMFAESEDISPEEVEASIRFSFSPW